MSHSQSVAERQVVSISHEKAPAFDVRREFSAAYRQRSGGFDRELRGRAAWVDVGNELGWSIAWDVSNGLDVSAGEIDIFRRIQRILHDRRSSTTT